MTGKTHLAVGTCAAMMITKPTNIYSALICLSVASIGSVIPDIDAPMSKSRKEINKILAISTVLTIVIFYIEYRYNLGLVRTIIKNNKIARVIIGIFIFLIICLFGRKKPHRSFMHSILALILLSLSVQIIYPRAVLSFETAMLSHIVLDTLNYKKVRIFYPLKFGISIEACKSSGATDRLILAIAITLLIFTIIFSIL